MPACWPARRHLTKKTVLCYLYQSRPCWPFRLFCRKTCLVFDWFYSNNYCLRSTITTPPVLLLEMNERSSDLTVFDWTTLKWKLPEQIKVSEFEASDETNLHVKRLCWDFPSWNAVFAPRRGGTAAEHPCPDVYKWTWKSCRALSPLLTSLRRTQHTCKHINIRKQTHVHTTTHSLGEKMTTLHNSPSDLNLLIPQCFSPLPALLWTHSFI